MRDYRVQTAAKLRASFTRDEKIRASKSNIPRNVEAFHASEISSFFLSYLLIGGGKKKRKKGKKRAP